MYVQDDCEGDVIETDFIIVKKKQKDSLHYYLADYDDSKTNTIMWCREKRDAYLFDSYNEANLIQRWLETLKINTFIDTI